MIGFGLLLGCSEPNPDWRFRADAALDVLAPRPEVPAAADASVEEVPPATFDASPGEVAPPPPPPPPVDLTLGLVGHWALDDGPGVPSIADGSGNGNLGTVTTTPLDAAWQPGKKGWALHVPSQMGAGAMIPATDRINAIRTFTISAWVKRLAPSSGDLHAAVFSRQSGTGSREVYTLAFHRDSLVVWIYLDATGSPVNVRGSGTVPVGEWLHVAVTYDGATVTLYQQGEPVGSRAHTTSLTSNSNPLYLGNNVNNKVADQPLVGLIDEVRFYDRALSPDVLRAVIADVE